MLNIQVSSGTFKRFEALAKPFVDTHETVLNRLIDYYESAPVQIRDGSTPSVSQPTDFPPDAIPSLKHTKFLSGRFDGANPNKANWNSLVELSLSKVMDAYKNIDDLGRISGANVCAYKKEDEGYKYLHSHGFSYQCVSAHNAALIVKRCAEFLGREASFEFEWRNKDKAHMPGKRGSVTIPKADLKDTFHPEEW